MLGKVRYQEGDRDVAYALAEEGIAIFRESGDRGSLAGALNLLGDWARMEGDYARAAEVLEESMTLCRQLGVGAFLLQALHNLGYVAQHRGDYRRSAALFSEGLAISQESGVREGVALFLAGLAGVFAIQRQPERAARLSGAAEAMLEAIGAPMERVDRLDYERNLAVARAALGDAFSAVSEEGRALTPEQAITHALEASASEVQ
jgi:tetratricopeptide (TPR) repeat protein